MKLRSLIVAAVSLLPAACFAGTISNPALSIPAGEGTLGVEYSHESNRFKPKTSHIESVSGPFTVTVDFSKATVDMNQAYIRGAYSAFEGNEVFLKIGAADSKSKNAFGDGSAFKDGFKLSGAVGVKQSFEIASDVRVGGAVQYAYFGSHKDEKSYVSSGTPTTSKIEFKNPWELNAALAISVAGKNFTPYIGPMVSWRRFTFDETLTTSLVTTNAKTVYRQDGMLGGLVGADFFRGPLIGNIEAQVSKKISIGASLSYLF